MIPPHEQLAPVALFVFNRPDHTTQTLDALARNTLAPATRLVVFSDGPRSEADAKKIEEVRAAVARVRGFRSVQIIKRDHNRGLARSIIDGVSALVAEYGRVIVVEDDLVTSRHFLQYMNDGLRVYQNDDRVASIHAYLYPVEGELPETFFQRGADCWGWATWARAWSKFEANGTALLKEIHARCLVRQFNANGTRRLTRMLEDQIAGRNDSWAVRWHASAFLQDMLTLYPGRSLVDNIGLDGSGRHCGPSSLFRVDINDVPVRVERIALTPDRAAETRFEAFFRARSSPLERMREVVKNGGVRRALRRLVRDWT